MTYVPTYCAACSRAALSPRGGVLACLVCGSGLQVLPGPTFPVSAAERFAEIDGAVTAAKLSESEVLQISEAIEQAVLDGEITEDITRRFGERFSLPNASDAPSSLAMLRICVAARKGDSRASQSSPPPPPRSSQPPSADLFAKVKKRSDGDT